MSEGVESPAGQRRALGFLLILSLAHAVIDLGSGAVVGLLPALREHFALSYEAVGTVILFSQLTSSVTQPFFGLLSDRSAMRWLLPLSLGLSGTGLAAAGFMPSYAWMLVAIVVSALGVAAFHPEGAHAAHNLAGGRQARAMAIYNVGGNLGYSFGTVYAGLLLSLGGMHGTAFAIAVPWMLGLVVLRLLPLWQAHEAQSLAAQARHRDSLRENNYLGAALITVLAIIRSIINLGVTTYLPFYWIDTLGHSEASARVVQLVYLIAGVGGTLLGAPLADRFGTKKVLIASWALLFPLQLLIPRLAGPALIACLFCAGFVVVSTNTTTLVMTQQYMPRALGLASGLNLGLAFGMGGVGAKVLGIVADRWGVVAVLKTVAWLVPALALLSLVLPAVRKVRPAAHEDMREGVGT